MGEHPELNDNERLVQRLLRGLQQRALLGTSDRARVALEANLVHQLVQLEEALEGGPVAPVDTTPPRRVALAMALALHSQPHLGATLGPWSESGTTDVGERGPYPAEAPFVASNEVMERALGLSQWELDDLREDVDRRLGGVLKQDRALTWLWDHFGLPDARPGPLFRVLFPGQDRKAQSVDVVRRRARMYVLLETLLPPLPSLYLGWLAGSGTQGPTGPGAFRARHVDHGLRRAMARGVGAEPHEVDELLEQMVALIPREQAVDFLERDQWRVTGLSTLTGLADDYRAGVDVQEPADFEELQWTRWLEVTAGSIRVARPAAALFDEFALDRAQRAMLQVYAALLARVEQTDEGDEGYKVEDLDLFDIRRHLRTALEPLVSWARDEAVHAHVAARLRVEVNAARDTLLPLAEAWEAHMEARWLAPPSPARRHTICGILLAHLVALRGSLVRVALREPDERWEHRCLTLLFAGHYLAEAPIERLWLKGLSDMLFDPSARLPPPEDIVGCWFWPVWQRVLDDVEQETAATLTP